MHECNECMHECMHRHDVQIESQGIHPSPYVVVWTAMDAHEYMIRFRSNTDQNICIRGIPVRMYMQALCETQVKSFQSQSQLVRNRKRQCALKCARTCARRPAHLCRYADMARKPELNQPSDVHVHATSIRCMDAEHEYIHTMHAVIVQHTYQAWSQKQLLL